MQLQCPSLLEGNEIPTKYTCDGNNISPPLMWRDAPQGTRTFALIVEDPDAPSTQGQNDFGNTGFGGPCPPQGMHRYVFRLFALDQTLDMAPGARKEDLLQVMEGHVLETAEITSTYTRQGR